MTKRACRGKLPSVEALAKLLGPKGDDARTSYFFGGGRENMGAWLMGGHP